MCITLIPGTFSKVSKRSCGVHITHHRYLADKQTFSSIANPIFTTNVFPADMDTTSIGLTVTHPDDDDVVHSVMDEMLQYTTEDGITTVSSLSRCSHRY
jgi:hypothetical protein